MWFLGSVQGKMGFVHFRTSWGLHAKPPSASTCCTNAGFWGGGVDAGTPMALPSSCTPCHHQPSSPKALLGPQPPCSTHCPSSAPDAQGRGEQASGGQTEQKASSTPQGMAMEGSHHSPATKTLKILYRCQDVVPRFVCQLQTEPSKRLLSFFSILDKAAEGCSPNLTSMGSVAPPHQP